MNRILFVTGVGVLALTSCSQVADEMRRENCSLLQLGTQEILAQSTNNPNMQDCSGNTAASLSSPDDTQKRIQGYWKTSGLKAGENFIIGFNGSKAYIYNEDASNPALYKLSASGDYTLKQWQQLIRPDVGEWYRSWNAIITPDIGEKTHTSSIGFGFNPDDATQLAIFEVDSMLTNLGNKEAVAKSGITLDDTLPDSQSEDQG